MKIKLHEKAASCHIINEFGRWTLSVYKNKITNQEHILLLSEKTDLKKPLLMRIHSSCITGDILHSLECDCREELNMSMKMVGEMSGAIFYLFQEGRNIGLTNKILAYSLKEKGFNTFEANEMLGLPEENRTYEMVKEILDDLNVKEIKLITNNPEKVSEMEKLGIRVIEMVPILAKVNKYNKSYLTSKKNIKNHKLKIK